MKRTLLIVFGVFTSLFCHAQAQLVKDLNIGLSQMRDANDYSALFTRSSNLVYFPVNDSFGNELWKTDGTSAGTQRVIDLNPGTSDGYWGSSIDFQNRLFFSGSDGSSGAELWATDGTASGTVLIKDVAPGSDPSYPSGFFQFGGKLYFTALFGTSAQLWRTDGTSLGTELFFDLSSSGISSIAPGTNIFYFFRETYNPNDNSTIFEFWKSNGTAGATKVMEFPYTPGGIIPSYLTVIGDIAYFSADNGSGAKIWRSDGTVVGTYSIEDNYGSSFFEYNGKLLYSNGGCYITDGSIGGSTLLTFNNINIGCTTNGKFYGISQGALIETDGTFSGTTEVAQLGPVYMFNLLPVIGTKIITAYNPGSSDATTQEIGAFDLNTKTISLLKDINPGSAGSNPRSWITINNKAVFLADDGVHGIKIWETDGTTSGTNFLFDPTPWTSDSYPNNLTTVGGSVLFTAIPTGGDYSGLWKTEGDAATTALLDSALIGGYLGTLANEAYYLNNLVFYKTNGLPGGKQTLIDLSGQSTSWGLNYETAVAGGKLFFSFGSYDGTLITGQELWVTDGSPSGSHIVKDIIPGIGSGIFRLSGADLNSRLVFPANDGTNGNELWITDGTDSGTSMIKDINPGAANSSPAGFTALGGYVFFLASDDSHGSELWKTDGTASGTALVKDIIPGSSGSLPTQLVAFNNLIYFVTNGDNLAKSLWKSDGTEAGTTIVMTFNSGITSLTKSGHKLFLNADDGIHGKELWISDGTAAGTVLVDIISGGGSSNPSRFFAADSVCYFNVNNGIWKSGGSIETTIPVASETATSNFAVLDNWLYFGANSTDYGKELFKVKIKSNQRISFPDFPTKVFTDTDFAVPATSSSGLPVSLEISNSNVVQLVNGVLHIVGTGTVTVTASQNGNDDFESALAVSKTLTVTKATQVVNFPAITAKSIDDKSFTLLADASSGLPLAFSTPSTKVQLSGSSVTITKPGKVRVTAKQPGDSNYDSAASVTREFCINPSKPSITMLLAGSIEDGLISSSSVGNIWYHDSNALPDTTKMFRPTVSGSYQVQVVIDGCQSPLSEPVAFVVTGLEQERKLSAYPNPTSQTITIDLPSTPESTSVSITNISGIQVAQVSSTSSTLTIDMSTLPSGLYFAKVDYAGKPMMIKIVKI